MDGCVGKHVSKESFFNFRFPVENVSKPFESTGVTLACEGQGAHKMVLSSTNTTGHQHQWCNEPPEGKLYFSKTFDQRYGDEEDMATNAYLTSPEEIQRLKCLVEKDPHFVNSSSWPKLTEWCSSCTRTRLVKLELPREEEKVFKEEMITEVATEGIKEEVIVKEESSDASTQTPPQKSRRRGGQASRRRRMLAYQLKLTERLGLPLSRLLKETDARSSRGKGRKLEKEVE